MPLKSHLKPGIAGLPPKKDSSYVSALDITQQVKAKNAIERFASKIFPAP